MNSSLKCTTTPWGFGNRFKYAQYSKDFGPIFIFWAYLILPGPLFDSSSEPFDKQPNLFFSFFKSGGPHHDVPLHFYLIFENS